MASIGKKGMKALATNTLNTLPKLELAVILIYFKIFPNVVRPSKIPASNIVKLFSSRIISEASFAISVAVLTDIPTSASRNATASLMPSPM
ncbi:Uncharacterised protein [Streptococcus pneumoniae]|nr:Uncharacterised protein [Streptococcus pneumoniae]CRG01168.1 Uncharacterised protein [Streptococcus pneumoniae]